MISKIEWRRELEEASKRNPRIGMDDSDSHTNKKATNNQKGASVEKASLAPTIQSSLL
jgi:hypothetical protein